ncbi:S8 family peptidase [Qipengyuania sp. GH1]|uniref:S8 family peptidase n=1 Tax=Qipengyuania aestuarii TaxID=2867241 RepID=UPI001C87E1D4|nr:S8 family serine peptidase [Qipengyuania aestuarii]MBX7535183.1 S8 family peptidase [Qipengyuania aestuarii]
METELDENPDLLEERRGEAKRYKVRFSSREALEASMAIETVGASVVVALPERKVLSVEVPEGHAPLMGETFSLFMREFDAEIVEDFRYDLEDLDFFGPMSFVPEDSADPSLDDVIDLIGARKAWDQSRGGDVVIAIIDTGIAGSRLEFPTSKRHPRSWAAEGEDPWTDYLGHGSMCAAIAAGTTAEGGVFDGVAPDAKIFSGRTHFYDTELAAIYDRLAELARAGERVIASNSFGLKTGSPPPPPMNSDFIPALDDAIAAGVTVCFSAGNYHELVGGTPTGHSPTSIWLHKCRDDVLTVGAAKLDGSMWSYSSRGPGQHHGQPGMAPKPDLVGITPPNGRIVYGNAVRALRDGWGTSGCCPQVAGLAALLISMRPELAIPAQRNTLFELIRDTSVTLGHHRSSQGSGRPDCETAVNRV